MDTAIHQESGSARQRRFGELESAVLSFYQDFHLKFSGWMANAHRRWVIRLRLAVDLIDNRAVNLSGGT
jgi:hypothetical protein